MILGLFTEMEVQGEAGLMKKLGVRLRVLTWVYIKVEKHHRHSGLAVRVKDVS